MNTTSPYHHLFLLLFFLSSPLPQADSAIRTSTKEAQKAFQEVTCPLPEDIFPCECINHGYLEMDCSLVEDETQLRQVFTASFNSTSFYRFIMTGNTGVRVLEDGVFGKVKFEIIVIEKSVIETVRDDALTSTASTLTSLLVLSCQLAIFPFHKLPDFKALKTLSLSSNQLHSIPSLSSSSINALDLNNNPISFLSTDVFKQLDNIGNINLNGTHLTDISSGTFVGLRYLFTVTLSHNKISYLHSLTFGLNSELLLDPFVNLQHNNIDKVEVDTFKGMRKGGSVDLIFNDLTSLKEEVWRPVFEDEITVALEGNSLACGCDIAWLVRDHDLLKFAELATCADGNFIADLNPDDFDIC